MSDVSVTVTDRAIISACNTPGGPVWKFMGDLADQIVDTAWRRSPVNNVLNAQHRGGVVGTYKNSWDSDRRGTRGHRLIVRVTNSADHAVFVEYGRSMSSKFQVFSWTAWGGKIRYIRAAGPLPFRKGTRRQQRSERGRMAVWARETGYEFGGRKTAARPGKYILTFATNSALVRNGLRAGI